VVLLLASGQFYTPWSWLPRTMTQFIAGALACAAVRRLRLSDRARRVAGYCSVLLIAAIVGILYLFDAHPITGLYDSSGVVDMLFVPLVMTLAIGMGSLPRLLSTRLMVYGGEISFSLYMVHELVHTVWGWAVLQFELSPQENRGNGTSSDYSSLLWSPRSCCITSSRSRRAAGCAGWLTCQPRKPKSTPTSRPTPSFIRSTLRGKRFRSARCDCCLVG